MFPLCITETRVCLSVSVCMAMFNHDMNMIGFHTHVPHPMFSYLRHETLVVVVVIYFVLSRLLCLAFFQLI